MPAVRQAVIVGLDKLQAKLKAHGAAVDKAISVEIRKGAIAIQTTARLLITNSPAGGNVYWFGKNRSIEHHASAPGQPPATNTGHLQTNIQTVIDPDDSRIAYVVSRAHYSFWLEYGTEHMKARPFMHPAYRQHRDEIVTRVRAAARAAR